MSNSIKAAMQNFAVSQALKYIEGNPEENIPKLMELVDKYTPEDWYSSQRNAIREAIEEKSNWYQLILRLYELAPGVRKAFFQNFLPVTDVETGFELDFDLDDDILSGGKNLHFMF